MYIYILIYMYAYIYICTYIYIYIYMGLHVIAEGFLVLDRMTNEAGPRPGRDSALDLVPGPTRP